MTKLLIDRAVVEQLLKTWDKGNVDCIDEVEALRAALAQTEQPAQGLNPPMTKKFKMPEPDGMDVGVYYWPETVRKALRDVLEQAALKCEEVGETKGDADECATEIRTMIKEIPA